MKNKDIVNFVDLSSRWHIPGKSKMTFVDLFCGAGGLSKGLEMAGLEGICGLDWFDEACATYKRNFEHPFVNGDITLQETKDEFYRVVNKQLDGRRLDIVAGGFPCQGFSMAGNRVADDPRNSLYKELIEIVKTLNPKFVICENVKGIRSMLDGKVEEKIVSDLKDIGYEVNVTTLCAADYYTPQKRERVIFIGNNIGVKNYHPKPIVDPKHYVTTGSAIGDLMSRLPDPEFNHVPTKHSETMQKRILETPEGHSLYKGYSDAWKKCPWDAPSCTVKENHGGVNLHPKLPRVLTAREMARLQSFPDDFIFEGKKNKQLVQIGNAVPPLLGKAIGLAVRYSNGDLHTAPVNRVETTQWGYPATLYAREEKSPYFGICLLHKEGHHELHFITDGPNHIQDPEELIHDLSDSLPSGSIITTCGGISPGGLHGLHRLKDFGWRKIGEFADKDLSYWGYLCEPGNIREWMMKPEHRDMWNSIRDVDVENDDRDELIDSTFAVIPIYKKI